MPLMPLAPPAERHRRIRLRFTNVSATTFAGKFADPNAVAGYDALQYRLLNGDLYVAYVQPSGVVTTGGGYIDEFDTGRQFHQSDLH